MLGKIKELAHVQTCNSMLFPATSIHVSREMRKRVTKLRDISKRQVVMDRKHNEVKGVFASLNTGEWQIIKKAIRQ